MGDMIIEKTKGIETDGPICREPMENQYVYAAMSQIPRLLSILDRKKGSKTYGCFDRYYWRYKMIDFAGSNFQIATLPLALVYSRTYPNNKYFKNHKIKDWTIAAMEFLSQTQNNDGTLNCTYPHIWTVASVAFPVYAVSEAYLLLSDEIKNPSNDAIVETLEKSCRWLLKSHDVDVINQQSGAMMALYNLYLVTGDEIYLKGAEDKIKLLLENRSSEGWFNEYGGGDVAYMTLTIDYLAKYYQKSGDKSVLNVLDDAIKFVSYFVHPNGTMGGEYCSRDPEFVIPSGFEILSQDIPLASAIADSNLNALGLSQVVDPNCLDDFYITFFLHYFFQAYDNYHPRIYDAVLPCKCNPVTKYFPENGNLIVRRDNYYMVVGGNKGGVLRIYSCDANPDLVFSDCGFLGVLDNGKVISNQLFGSSTPVFDEKSNTITIKGSFNKVSDTVFTPTTMVLSRIGLCTTRNISFIREALIHQLRRIVIKTKSPIPLEFKRTIRYDENKVSIQDDLIIKGRLKLGYLNIAEKYSAIYGQSKEMFQIQELSGTNPMIDDNLAELISDNGSFSICREMYPNTKELKCKISVKN